MSGNYVLDACALIAFLRDEPGADEVTEILKSAQQEEVTIYLNVINLLEVYYDIYRTTGKVKADNELVMIQKLPLQIQTAITDEILISAGRLKAMYRISLADSIAIAQAIVTNGELLTADHHEFDAIDGKEDIQFHWIR